MHCIAIAVHMHTVQCNSFPCIVSLVSAQGQTCSILTFVFQVQATFYCIAFVFIFVSVFVFLSEFEAFARLSLAGCIYSVFVFSLARYVFVFVFVFLLDVVRYVFVQLSGSFCNSEGAEV